ncbi:MarR family winged helix-turn-helix transcriptional regulator [Ruegeria sp. HKCCSP346]|uniref:MarR family winged helix-turn-helix transcriptional regulator n=1 Tax=Ruegeria sp. HKCCSP346 TaxID=2794830 RepID=UPI001AE14A04|nr:MarR family winged helix-turn-helix transcriptional regulator [Ruegeria sp. HKCCSP346]
MQELSKAREQNLRGLALFAIISRFREVDSEMPVQQMLCLVWVANNEGKSQKELRDSLGMASSTASRNLNALADYHRLGKPGLGLVEMADDFRDRRQKVVRLTPKGRTLMNEVLNYVIAEAPSSLRKVESEILFKEQRRPA